MIAANPDSHPSRQVERIREILVGRQLDSVERRLERLETRVPSMPTAPDGDVFMICLEVFEKRHNLEIQEIREGMAATRAQHAEDIHRLANQIQSVARNRAPDLESVAGMEKRIGDWLQSWQTGFSRHAQQRENFLIHEFRGELQKIREWVTAELMARDSRAATAAPQAVHASLHRLAAAAREFAETAAQHTGSPPTPA